MGREEKWHNSQNAADAQQFRMKTFKLREDELKPTFRKQTDLAPIATTQKTDTSGTGKFKP